MVGDKVVSISGNYGRVKRINGTAISVNLTTVDGEPIMIKHPIKPRQDIQRVSVSLTKKWALDIENPQLNLFD